MPDTATTLPSFSAGDILNRNSDFYVRLRDENNLAPTSRSLLVAGLFLTLVRSLVGRRASPEAGLLAPEMLSSISYANE